MSKVVQAINAMISHPEKITNVISGGGEKGDEYFFLYDNKYKWSTFYNSEQDVYRLYFYPSNEGIEYLASLEDWQPVDMVSYGTDTLETKEARDSFRELYALVKEKVYGVDKALDDIIKRDS